MESAKKRMLAGALVALAVLIVAGLNLVTAGPAPFALAAPYPAITPVGAVNPVRGAVGNLITIPHTVTADGRDCRDTRDWLVADIGFAIDMGETNTTTLMLEHSNNNASYTDGPVLANAVTADATGLNRYDLYGAYTCLSWDVANANPVTITGKVLLRR